MKKPKPAVGCAGLSRERLVPTVEFRVVGAVEQRQGLALVGVDPFHALTEPPLESGLASLLFLELRAHRLEFAPELVLFGFSLGLSGRLKAGCAFSP